MHIQLLTLGSRGDVQPYVALGTALKARGHEVTVTTGRGFDDMIESAGLQATSVSDDVREMIQDPVIQDAINSLSGKFRAWRAYKGEIARQLDEAWAIVNGVRPDIMVYHIKMSGTPVYGEKLGIPALPSFLMPGLVATSAYPSPLLPVPSLGRIGNRLSHESFLALARAMSGRMLRTWQRQRLPDLSGRSNPFEGFDPSGAPATRLHAYSRHIVARPDDWTDREQITGAWTLDEEAGWSPPDTLVDFLESGPPPVYFGFGSMPGMDAGRNTRAALGAIAQTGDRAILATGWGGLESIPVPDTVHVLEKAPHAWLFPRCAAVVHHGGAGTTHAGLRAGRPTIICPFGLDQPMWGRLIAKLGAGPPPIPQKTLSADALAAALRAVRDPAMIAKADQLGELMRSEPGTAAAVRILEDRLERR